MDVNKIERKGRAMREETKQRADWTLRDGRWEGWMGGCL